MTFDYVCIYPGNLIFIKIQQHEKAIIRDPNPLEGKNFKFGGHFTVEIPVPM